MQKRITLLNEATVIRSRYSDFGNPAIPKFGIRGFPPLLHLWNSGPPPVTAGRRPTITRGLALSASFSYSLEQG